jgi:multidrug efflux pump subunit AcrB
MMSDQMPSVVGRVSPLELGPPVGWPVQYRVSGPDLSQVRSIALRLAEVLGGDPHISEISYDWMEPARQVRITIDQDQARLLGLSSRTIAEAINTLMAGTPITQVRDDIYLIPVITRALDEQRSSLSTLRALQLPLPNGRTVPLSQVATFDFKQEYPLIWRRQRVPTLTVLADVPPTVSLASAVDALAPAIEKFRESLPKDYHIAVGGTVEESANSQASVFAKVPLMLLLMLFFLMAQLHSFSRLFLVVSVIPMGLIGIVFTLLIVGKPLGFVAILGILALFGMIARNAVLLIEQIETERTQRPHVWDAVVEATLSRFRPIMLTAISTVLGFIPIAADVFWGPMAFAIMGGLFVATILTLIVLPALYVALFRIKEPTQEVVVADPPGLEVQR